MKGKQGNRKTGNFNSKSRTKKSTSKGNYTRPSSQLGKYDTSKKNITQNPSFNTYDRSIPVKGKVNTKPQTLVVGKENDSSSDSEPDALSSLVSSFAKSKQNPTPFLSSDDSSTDDENSPEEVEHQLFESGQELDDISANRATSEEDSGELSDYKIERTLADSNFNFSAEVSLNNRKLPPKVI